MTGVNINKNDDPSSVSYSVQNRPIIKPSKLKTHQDQRRLVFVSLIGLYRSWKVVPTKQMDNALILIPLRRKWIHQPLRYRSQLRSCFVSQITLFSDLIETQNFIKLLKRKDKQGLVVWILDYCDKDYYPFYPPSLVSDSLDLNPLVATFWHCLSRTLTSLEDPVSGNKYHPLHLHGDCWEQKYKSDTKYEVKLSSILTELYFLSIKYRTMKEIIYQSNPYSLHPIVYYGDDKCRMISTTTNGLLHMYGTESVNDIDDDDQWFISDDYDPEIL